MKNKGQYRWSLFVATCMLAFWAVQPCMGLVVSELMYHPVEEGGIPSGDENLEFIELYNNRAVIEDLSGCEFTNGIEYKFPPGVTLAGKSYLVVAKDPAVLEAAYGITGVYGPFTKGKLNNDGERVEFSNANGQIIISFRYNDTWPWPNSPDGTGHSLILARAGGDPEEASTWSPSTYIGGTPGGPDEVQVEPEDPTLVKLVEIGHPGRYFKGTTEPSPGAGGVATTTWTQISFNDNPATTAWLDGPSGYGYSDESSETQWIRTFLNDMNGGYLSVYARLRFTLTAEQIASFSGLRAKVHYDDGFVLYLNGIRVAPPTNVTGNPPAYDTGADGASDYDGGQDLDLTGLLGELKVGTNVLAMQGHNRNLSGSSDCVVSPELSAIVEPPDPGGDDIRARLVINEVLANSDAPPGTDWIEIYNPGPVAVNLGNVYLSDGRFDLLQYKIPDGIVLQPGQFRTFFEGTLLFALAYNGETIFLTAGTDEATPRPLRVLDAVRFGNSEADVTLGRFPDGADSFVKLSSPTLGTANAMAFHDEIVINEIMYHHGERDANYEYVELYNSGSSTIPLDGLGFTDGIRYDFNESSQVRQMAPGSYLVVAKNPTLLESVYSNLTIGTNLVGPYKGSLDDHSERIRLGRLYQDPDTGDVNMVTVDEVTYYDGGRWPRWADGQGSSMELRDPRSNNNCPDAWADSDESNKTTWKQYSFTISGSDSRYRHYNMNVFGMMLLNRGDVLIDDVQLIISGSNRLGNGSFESGESSWRILGNHVQSHVTTDQGHPGNCLRIVATGHGDPGANRINQSFSTVYGGTVTFKFSARWLRGTRYMLLRTTEERNPEQPPWPAHPFKLDVPLDQGTPGRQNTAYTFNRGPDILNVRHAPVLPAGNQPIVVTATVTDNDGVGPATLYYRSEGAAGFTGTAMIDNGSGDDEIAGDSIFTATIPGAGGGTMRAFYIEASDGSASTRFPTKLEPSADVPDRTCLVRVGDPLVATQFATYRLWLSNAVFQTFDSSARPNLSNELLDCTFVFNDTDVFYNVRVRYRGSPFIRGGSGWGPTGRRPWRIDFNPDQKFRSREEINLDRTEGSNRGPLQERASYWFYKQMGLEFSNQEYVNPIVNGASFTSYEDVQKIDGDYIDSWFGSNDEGYIHKIDDYFEYNVSGTSHRNLDEGLKYDGSHPLIAETYRWGFEKRSHRENDEWDHIFNFAVKMNTSTSNGPAYEAAIESVIHPQHFARVLAIRHAVGDWDSYGYNRGKNNYFYYALPEGKWYLLPWDIDFTLGSGNGTSTNLFAMNSGQFPEVYKFVNYPKYRRMYLQAFSELVYGPWRTSYGTRDAPTAFDRFLDDAADTLIANGGDGSRRNSIKQFVRDRRNYILTQVPALTFAITTNNGDDFCTSRPTATIAGIAPLIVAGIAVNGTPLTAQFSGSNAFEVEVPIAVGSNRLNVQGLDFGGNPVLGVADSITVTRVPPCTVSSVSPATVCNGGTAELTIYGSGFEPGSATSVAFTSASEEIGFDALYVQNNQAFDRIDAATVLLDDPMNGVGDPTFTVHPWINLYNSGNDHGEFSTNETSFAAPFNVDGANYAVRFTGYIYAPSPGIRYFGVNSDDGFVLSIDGQLVGEYADARAPATSDVTGNLTAGTMTFNFPAEGTYYLVLDFFENGGGEAVELFQTNSSGGNRRLINVDAELIVFRDDVARINATDVVVVDENTITCRADVDGASPEAWNVIVTPECGNESRSELADGLDIAACRANFNGDSLVNSVDYAVLADAWGMPCSGPSWCGGRDLDASGSVDMGDIAIFCDEEWLVGAR